MKYNEFIGLLVCYFDNTECLVYATATKKPRKNSAFYSTQLMFKLNTNQFFCCAWSTCTSFQVQLMHLQGLLIQHDRTQELLQQHPYQQY